MSSKIVDYDPVCDPANVGVPQLVVVRYVVELGISVMVEFSVPSTVVRPPPLATTEAIVITDPVSPLEPCTPLVLMFTVIELPSYP